MSREAQVEGQTAATLAAYRRWAPLYPPVAHNPLMRAEEAAMRQCWPPVSDRRVLDLACGSGRYTHVLADGRPGLLVAVDFCEPMLAQVTESHRVRARMTELPFASHAFDVVICGLAIGHAVDLDCWMTEISRVLAPGGVLLYSDFHPGAAQAGLPRSFKDERNVVTLVPHCAYGVDQQCAAAKAAGLVIETVREVRAGIELTEHFDGSGEFYRRWQGLPVVLIVRAHK